MPWPLSEIALIRVFMGNDFHAILQEGVPLAGFEDFRCQQNLHASLSPISKYFDLLSYASFLNGLHSHLDNANVLPLVCFHTLCFNSLRNFHDSAVDVALSMAGIN